MRRKRKLKKKIGTNLALVLTICIGFLSVAGLFAQQKNDEPTTRSVEGTVVTAAGQPVAAAVVQLKNSKTLQIRSFITQADGRYHFAGLTSDVDYQLRADLNGASSSWKSLSIFNTNKIAVINLKFKK